MNVFAQIQPPPFEFTPMTWAAFIVANLIILFFTGRPLIRDLKGWFK